MHMNWPLHLSSSTGACASISLAEGIGSHGSPGSTLGRFAGGSTLGISINLGRLIGGSSLGINLDSLATCLLDETPEEPTRLQQYE